MSDGHRASLLAWTDVRAIGRRTGLFCAAMLAIYTPVAVLNAWLRDWSLMNTREHLFSVVLVTAIVAPGHFVLQFLVVIHKGLDRRKATSEMPLQHDSDGEGRLR